MTTDERIDLMLKKLDYMIDLLESQDKCTCGDMRDKVKNAVNIIEDALNK